MNNVLFNIQYTIPLINTRSPVNHMKIRVQLTAETLIMLEIPRN